MTEKKKRKPYILSQESRDKISAAQKGRKRSPEHRKKMSEAMLAFWKRYHNGR